MTIFQFSKDFKWGTATAAYQIEGSATADGRGPSIWDTFAKTPGKVFNGDNGDMACDSYHRYEEDIALMNQLGIQSYRFSVSWSRILPDGDGEINQAGLDYYHRFVDKLLENGIEPFCTLYHWDLPQTLQDAGGWESSRTVEAFVKFSEIMYREFNGKIKSWLTFNEHGVSPFYPTYWVHMHQVIEICRQHLMLVMVCCWHTANPLRSSVSWVQKVRSVSLQIWNGLFLTASQKRIKQQANATSHGLPTGSSTRSSKGNILILWWTGLSKPVLR